MHGRAERGMLTGHALDAVYGCAYASAGLKMCRSVMLLSGRCAGNDIMLTLVMSS